MTKSSSFLPDLRAAASHRGFSPRPAQVSLGFSGLRYFGATFPLTPRPNAAFDRPPPMSTRESLASSDSKVRRSSATLVDNTASILPRRPRSASIDIDFKFITMLLHQKDYSDYIDPAANASQRLCRAWMRHLNLLICAFQAENKSAPRACAGRMEFEKWAHKPVIQPQG